MTIWREREEKTGSSMLVGELGYFVLLLLQCSFVRWQGTCIIQDFRAQTAEIGQMSECQNGMLVRPNT